MFTIPAKIGLILLGLSLLGMFVVGRVKDSTIIWIGTTTTSYIGIASIFAFVIGWSLFWFGALFAKPLLKRILSPILAYFITGGLFALLVQFLIIFFRIFGSLEFIGLQGFFLLTIGWPFWIIMMTGIFPID